MVQILFLKCTSISGTITSELNLPYMIFRMKHISQNETHGIQNETHGIQNETHGIQ